MAKPRRRGPEAAVPVQALSAADCEDAMCNQNTDLTAQTLALTAGTTAVSAALQMMLDQASVRGEAMRQAQYSANLAQTVELAALGAMLNQMFSGSQPRTVDVKTVSTVPLPTPLAVS